ncbi:hypothetical protein DERP_004347 [Dermatophagoides pteronyssinus]|uniref:Uncharacterized protein n=1 Tax=Dermatophagoides pteronyssinus TaxID=6956 RepID=A0ABQ8JP71_DERPT|nr:hypothetical protein DERP_004347 [Dermatophagoides pteronyssinus]
MLECPVYNFGLNKVAFFNQAKTNYITNQPSQFYMCNNNKKNHGIRFAFVNNVEPTSPRRQSQQEHFKQSSCQY